MKDVSKEIEKRARGLLESQPHFRGRTRLVQYRYSDRRLYLTGKVHSYYLKQIAQEAVRDLEEVDLIVNRIVVASSISLENPILEIESTSTRPSASRRFTAR